MKVQMIGTWQMCERAFAETLKKEDPEKTAFLIEAVRYVEDDPLVHTVGQYACPNEAGYLELDSAYMDGDTHHAGAVLGARRILHPVEAAYRLSERRNNCILAGEGADLFAAENDIPTGDLLMTGHEPDMTKTHDTVGMIQYDHGTLRTAISSSGRKGKHPGRIGDSPLIGSGFYCDSTCGAAVATGNGEDILRACLTKETVDAMAFGMSVYEALETVGNRQRERMIREYGETDFCLLAVDKEGQAAAYTTGGLFPFAVIEEGCVKLYFALRQDGHTVIREADAELRQAYHGD